MPRLFSSSLAGRGYQSLMRVPSAFSVSVLAAGFLCQTPVEALRLFSGLGSMVDSLWEQRLT